MCETSRGCLEQFKREAEFKDAVRQAYNRRAGISEFPAGTSEVELMSWKRKMIERERGWVEVAPELYDRFIRTGKIDIAPETALAELLKPVESTQP